MDSIIELPPTARSQKTLKSTYIISNMKVVFILAYWYVQVTIYFAFCRVQKQTEISISHAEKS